MILHLFWTVLSVHRLPLCINRHFIRSDGMGPGCLLLLVALLGQIRNIFVEPEMGQFRIKFQIVQFILTGQRDVFCLLFVRIT